MRTVAASLARSWRVTCVARMTSVMGLSALWACGCSADADRGAPLIILHTNDLHDHVAAAPPSADYSPETAGDDETVGGFARLAAAVATERDAAGETPLLLLDVGDFCMGTGFTMLNDRQGAVLSLMHDLRYDAIAIGNHELDLGTEYLAQVIRAAVADGFDTSLLAANLRLDSNDPASAGLQQLWQEGILRTSVVKELSTGVRVGIVGVLGTDGRDSLSPMAGPVSFDDTEEELTATVRAAVDQLREDEGVDMVVCLAHSGLYPDGTGPAVRLAEAVDGIDVILAGHSHLRPEAVARVGSTVVAQAPGYGEALGRLQLSVRRNGRPRVVGFQLIDLDDTVHGDPTVQQRVEELIAAMDGLLAEYGEMLGIDAPLAYAQVVAETDFDLPQISFEEDPIGSLVTDAFLHVTRQVQAEAPPVIAIEADGVVRASLSRGRTGQVWLADLLAVHPLGGGEDGIFGGPLVTFFLRNPELRAGLEVIALVGNSRRPGWDQFFAQLAGMKMAYRAGGLPFNSVLSAQLDGAAEPLDLDDASECHKVVCSGVMAMLLTQIDTVSGGLATVTPMHEDCVTPVTDWRQRMVDLAPEQAGTQQLKSWEALRRYLAQLEDLDSDGIPDVPARYRSGAGRVIAQP